MACEVNTHKDDSLFASTPPLEALRLLLSWTATEPPSGGLPTGGPSSGGRQPRRSRRKVLLIDVRKAHLHAVSVREVYVQMPPELRAKYPGMCWKLKRCLYGTRDAPAQWEALYIAKLQEMGFTVGSASANCLYNPKLNVQCVVHGDDFTFSGSDQSLDLVEAQMKKAFLCKVEGRLGGEPHDLKQARILNRVITWNDWGIQYEADPRHAEVLVRELKVS